MKTELVVVEGMQFDRGYASAYMATDTDKMEAVLDDPMILITDKKISNIQEILPILEQIVQMGKKLLIMQKTSKAKHWRRWSSTSCAACSTAWRSRHRVLAIAERQCWKTLRR